MANTRPKHAAGCHVLVGCAFAAAAPPTIRWIPFVAGDDGGPGSEFSECSLGSDCADCGGRCYLTAVPQFPAIGGRYSRGSQPYIHSAWPDINTDTGGSFRRVPFAMDPLWRSSPPPPYYLANNRFGEAVGPDQPFMRAGGEMRAVTYPGAWTMSLVLASDNGNFWGQSTKLVHDGDLGWDRIESSIGIGSQLYCGQTAAGYSCAGGDREVDRGSCTASTLFGEEYDLCTNYNLCNFFVAEGHGPREGDVWCRVSRFTNDAAHQCKDEPSKFCHVVTLRVGPKGGTYLRVDEQEADTNIAPIPSEQAAFFGGGTAPVFETANMKEMVLYDIELDDACLDALHENLLERYMMASASHAVAVSPPPPAALQGVACAAHAPYIASTSSLGVSKDANGSYAGPYTGFYPGIDGNRNQIGARDQSILNGAALYKSSWTFSMVIGSSEFAQFASRKFFYDDTSSVGLGAQSWCGSSQTGTSCPNGDNELDRGSCTQETLFGEDRYLCHTNKGCPFVVAEHRGPRTGEVWCRVTRLSNDIAHHCRDDPSQFCHVITVRAGPANGTYLRVDEMPADRNVKAVPADQAAFWGGGSPQLDSSLIKEVLRPPPLLRPTSPLRLMCTVQLSHFFPSPRAADHV